MSKSQRRNLTGMIFGLALLIEAPGPLAHWLAFAAIVLCGVVFVYREPTPDSGIVEWTARTHNQRKDDPPLRAQDFMRGVVRPKSDKTSAGV